MILQLQSLKGIWMPLGYALAIALKVCYQLLAVWEERSE